MGKLGTIYKIENTVSGKVYIGQTRQSFKKRKQAHIYELNNNRKRNKKLQSAWDKYGSGNFRFSIIGRYPLAELDEKEVLFIRLHDSYRQGYNMTTGGNQVMHNQNHSSEARKKISQTSLSRWSDKGYREKMMGRPVYHGADAPRAVRVICINDQKVFGSMVDASLYYGICHKKVSEACRGHIQYTGLEETGRKLQFSYHETGTDYFFQDIKHPNEKKGVLCVTTGQIFDSITEAARATGAPGASISHVCRGKRKKAGGLEWRFT